MKKILSFALLLCSLAVANAQVAIVCNEETYQNGDTVTVGLQKTAMNCEDIAFINQGHTPLNGMVVTMTEIETAGLTCWGLCTGVQCVPTLTSAPFSIAIGETYDQFSIDIMIDDAVERPYGVYNLEISNGTVTCAIVVRLQAYPVGGDVAIDDVRSNVALQAYPNPAEGQFSISYSVSQPAALAIFDVQGRMVRQMPVSGEGAVKVSDLAAGIYTYGIIENGRRAQMRKLVVK